MRPIDADLLKEQMESVCMGIMSGTDSYDVPLKTIDDAPTIEPKHGKWESNEYLYTTRQTRCSECKTEFYVDDLLNVGEGAQEYLPNFCPHCGAKMGEVEE